MFLEKQKNFTFGTKISYMYIFSRNLEKLLLHLKSAPSNLLEYYRLMQKKKETLNLGA